MFQLLSASADRREEWAEELLDRLTPLMSALGVVFFLVVLGLDDTSSRLLGVGLAAYSVVVFATLAGSLGAYFLETRR